MKPEIKENELNDLTQDYHIRKTRDYDMFTKLEGNRTVESARVNKICKSIMDVGYIISPIIVNEKLEVIDGQGRLEALQILDLPVYYIIHKGTTIKHCVSMNIYQTNWSLKDYIESYASRQIESYVFVAKLLNEFPAANINTIFASLFFSQKADTTVIKQGTLYISEKLYEQARERMQKIYPIFFQLRKQSLGGSQQLLAQSILIAFQYNIDMNRLIERTIDYIHTANKWIDTASCMEELNIIYNRGLKANRENLCIKFNEQRARIKTAMILEDNNEAEGLGEEILNLI